MKKKYDYWWKKYGFEKTDRATKIRFFTEIGRFHWNQGKEVAHFAWFGEPWSTSFFVCLSIIVYIGDITLTDDFQSESHLIETDNITG